VLQGYTEERPFLEIRFTGPEWQHKPFLYADGTSNKKYWDMDNRKSWDMGAAPGGYEKGKYGNLLITTFLFR
jgi:hypothetical protein